MDMQQELLELASVKQQIDALTKHKAKVEEGLVAELTRRKQKTITNGDIKGTLVAGTRITIDQERLKKSIPAAMWKKITTLVLDKEKLEAHIVTGDIDPNVVAQASDEKDTKPYIRVTGTVGPMPPPARTASTRKVVRPRAR